MYIFKLNKEDYAGFDRDRYRPRGQPEPKKEPIAADVDKARKTLEKHMAASGGGKSGGTPHPTAGASPRSTRGEGSVGGGTPHPPRSSAPSPRGEGFGGKRAVREPPLREVKSADVAEKKGLGWRVLLALGIFAYLIFG